MTEAEVTSIVTAITVGGSGLLALAAVVAGLYIFNIYRQRHEEALFLTRLVWRDIRVSFASAWILGYLALALSGYSLGRPWGAVAIAIPVWLMMYGPISDAILWFRERRLQ